MASVRLHSLDGLRGLAALAVVAEHSLITFPLFWLAFSAPHFNADNVPLALSILTFSPLHLFWSGGAAVKIFFVLSGLVLSLPFWMSGKQTISTYLVRRLFRIYPIYIVSIALALLIFTNVDATFVPTASDWFNRYWHGQFTLQSIVRAILFLPGDIIPINAPLWTLIHEMRISLLFPLLIWAMRRRQLSTLATCLALSLFAKIAMNRGIANNDINSILETLSQVWLFAIGALISKHLFWIQKTVSDRSNLQQVLFFSAAILLLLSRWMLPMPNAISFFTAGLGAAMVIVSACASPWLIAPLEKPMPQFAGKISYGLYAIHFPIIIASVHVLPLPQPVAVLIGVLIAVLLARVLNKVVEIPMVSAGRRLTTSAPPRPNT